MTNNIKDGWKRSVEMFSLKRLMMNIILSVLFLSFGLKAHSESLINSEVSAITEVMEDSYDGIGVHHDILNDTTFISLVIPGSPSGKAGIKKGDKIIAINRENVTGKGFNNDYVSKKLRGVRGTEVTIDILRKGHSELLSFRIVRDRIQNESVQSSQQAVSKMEQLFDWIDNYYVDAVNLNRLSDSIIQKTLQEIDPHSVYVSESEVRAMIKSEEGSYDGIGIRNNILNDTVLIFFVVPDSPSEKSGIRKGDKIIAINGENVAGKGINNDNLTQKLRGPRGTEVSIDVLRKGYSKLLSFRIIRDKIPTKQQAVFKITQLFDRIDSIANSLDTLNLNRLSDNIIRKTLQELDPHSSYFTQTETRAMNGIWEGYLGGIGVSTDILNDTILIYYVENGSPSEKAGIRNGDKIIAINGECVAGTGIKDNEVVKRVRGTIGTEVTINILRKGYSELLPFRIVRDKIPINTINAAYKVTDKIGYIKLSLFLATSKKEFDDALQKLKNEGVTDLILDLCGNGGGLIDMAIQLVNEFLESGRLIAFTEGVNNPRKEYFADSSGEFITGKLVLMIDENTASASEILAGTIQDWDRGIIVGRRSYGKALAQSHYMFADSSMLWLTTKRNYIPSGRTVQKPYNMKNDEYFSEVHNRLQTGELMGQIQHTGADSLKFQTLVKKRTVYGGGGIMPDVFVAIDTLYNTSYYRKLTELGIFDCFFINFMDENRQSLKLQYPTFEQYDKNFTVTKTMLDELQDFAQKEGLNRNPEEFAQSQQYLKLRIKAHIAFLLWDKEEFYHRIINQENPIFLQAVEVIKNLN